MRAVLLGRINKIGYWESTRVMFDFIPDFSSELIFAVRLFVGSHSS